MQRYNPSSSFPKSSIVRSPVDGDIKVLLWKSTVTFDDAFIAIVSISVQLPRHGMTHFRQSKMVTCDLLLGTNVEQGNVTDLPGNP